MATYDEARNKTRSNIIQAFWELYSFKDASAITVKDITERAGIHRSTFYIHFDCAADVLSVVKQEQLGKLRAVCSTYISKENGYAEFLDAMRKLYDDNENFLILLLCQDGVFSAQYRQIMIDKLRKDIGWHQYPEGSKSEIIVDSVLNGLIGFFLTALQTRVVPLESAYRFASYSVDHGIAPALEREFEIMVKPSRG